MTLAEYTTAVEELERGEYPEVMQYLGYDLAAAADFLARELQGIAWQPWIRPTAVALAGRCLAIRDQVEQAWWLARTHTEEKRP